MPRSRSRKKDNPRPPQTLDEQLLNPSHAESTKWLPKAAVGGFILGLGWIVTYYVSNTSYPIPGIGAWNMLIGLAAVALGFTLLTRWR